MRLIDSHCHLTHGRLAGDIAQVLQRGRQAGIVAFVCASADLAEAAAAMALAGRHADVFFTAGVHPHEAKAVVSVGAKAVAGEGPGAAAEGRPGAETDSSLGAASCTGPGGPASPSLTGRPGYLQQLEEFAAADRCMAIGEIGLDYHYDFSARYVQRQVFAEQLALAGRLGTKVVIHTREAFEDTLAIIRESGLGGEQFVFHSCTEEPANVRRMLDLGAMVGFSGIATFKNAAHLRASARLMPAERMLIETDSPYLSPEPVRAMKINEPSNVAHVVRCLAAERGVPAEELAEQTTINAERFFGLVRGR